MPSIQRPAPDPFIDQLNIPVDPLLYGLENLYVSDTDDSDDDIDLEPLLHEGDDPLQNQNKKRAKELTRDEKLRVRCLHKDAGWTYQTIFEKRMTFQPQMPTLTLRQIQKACDPLIPLTPRKNQGKTRPPKVTEAQKATIKAFLEEKPEHLLIPWIELPYRIEGLDHVRDRAIKRALKDMGYLRKERQKKIVHTEVHEKERLRWAEEHKDLTPEQWAALYVFSDETWVNGTPPYRQWLTINTSENPDDFAEIRERPQGWMFWGSIHGKKLGPHLFWEKSAALAVDEDGQPIFREEGQKQRPARERMGLHERSKELFQSPYSRESIPGRLRL